MNVIRLILAVSVILYHSYPVTGKTSFPLPYIQQFAAEWAVDGFFVISGFLLVGSWLNKPKLWPYLRNRALRILPGFWCCLLVTAFVIAPISSWMTHRSVAELFQGPQSSWNYVWHNAFLRITQRGISGTPAGVPFDGVWNGSLWTLFWEAIAYVCLPILGLLGLLKRRSVVLGLLAGTWLLNLGVAYHLLPPNYFLVQGSRLGLMFMCGMALHLYGAQISSRRSAVVAALAILIAAPLLHDYRILGAPALAYLVIWTGASIRRPVLELRNRDISYGMYIYAFTVNSCWSSPDCAICPLRSSR